MTERADSDAVASSGEPDTQYKLGLSLLSGRPALEEVQRARSLLESASAAGHAHASETCALLEAMGVAAVQSWDRAFDYLQLAAQQGSSSAQRQLALLARNDEDPEVAENVRASQWQALRGRIRIEQLLTVSPPISVSTSPRVRIVEGFATPAECGSIIRLARDRIAPATVFDKDTGGQIQDPVRDNRQVVLQITEMDVITEVLRNRIGSVMHLPVRIFEPTQVLHYSVGQRFKPHHDFLDPSNAAYRENIDHFGQRIATFLIYLNDDFEGGETSFPAIKFKYHGRTGDALFFANVDREGRPDVRTLHAGLPPTAGEKWVFSQWIRDREPAA